MNDKEKCNKCRCWRETNDFIKNDKVMKTCIICRDNGLKYRVENVDKVKEGKKKYVIENADKVKEYQKHYYIENTDKFKEKQKKYYIENTDKVKEYQNHYRIENVDKIKEKRETDKKENPLHIKFMNMIGTSKANDKKKNRTYDADEYITEDYLNELWVKQNKKCFYEDCECELILCFNKDTREDSMLTIQRLKNDIAHVKSNSVLSCFRCNVIAHKELNELN